MCIRDRDNARLNGIENVEFFVGKAEEVLPAEYKKNGIYADVIVVDPPRKGCEESLLEMCIRDSLWSVLILCLQMGGQNDNMI